MYKPDLDLIFMLFSSKYFGLTIILSKLHKVWSSRIVMQSFQHIADEHNVNKEISYDDQLFEMAHFCN